jgi:ribulose-bisphosphate carboxylase large chain
MAGMRSTLSPADRLRVRYELRLKRGESARAKAAGIAREQTVEISPRIAPAALERRTMGQVVAVATDGPSKAEATVDYPWRELVSDLPQLLNLLFGNVSMQSGIRIAGVEWPEGLLARFPGPRHGIEGVRERTGAHGRPLLATVLKPIGLSPRELARHAADCALAGIDLIKDDHSLADQPAAPFRERVQAVASEIRRANRATGRSTLYFPNLTGPVDRMAERVDDLAESGIAGAVVAPAILGLDSMRSLAASSGLVLLAHPALTGSLVAHRRGGHGLAPGLFYGDLLRLAGADIVNFPLHGGRFDFPRASFESVRTRLAAPLGTFLASCAMVAGGVDAATVARLRSRLGDDVVYLVGGELYRGGRVRERATQLAKLVSTGGGPAR